MFMDFVVNFSGYKVGHGGPNNAGRSNGSDGASRSFYRQLSQVLGVLKSTVFMVLGAVCVSICSYFGLGIYFAE